MVVLSDSEFRSVRDGCDGADGPVSSGDVSRKTSTKIQKNTRSRARVGRVPTASCRRQSFELSGDAIPPAFFLSIFEPFELVKRTTNRLPTTGSTRRRNCFATTKTKSQQTRTRAVDVCRYGCASDG